jgi:hypothetical protein
MHQIPLSTYFTQQPAESQEDFDLDEVLRENRRLEPDLTGLKA